ncbi:MAG: helix-hairpin-helix domain-containing protein [Acidimicrobiia bacterium]
MSVSDLPMIGAPATRALASIGVTSIGDLVNYSKAELLALHGFGPKALRMLSETLADAGLSLRA